MPPWRQVLEDSRDLIAPAGYAAAVAANGYAVVVATDDGDAAAPADDGTRLMTVERMGAFNLELTIMPAVADEPSAVQSTITNDQPGFAFAYVTGSNREVTVPDSLDVTIADNDAPGVLILQSGASTDVIEPTEMVRLGSGYTSQVITTRFRIGLGLDATTNLPVPPKADQTWTVYLVDSNDAATPPPSVSYAHRAGVTPTFAQIATGLAAKINDLAGPLAAAYDAEVSGEYLTIKRPTPIYWWQLVEEQPFSVFIKVSEGTATKAVLFIGDFGTATAREIGIHDSVFIAQDLDSAKWNTNSSTDIVDSTTIPHLTVFGTGDGNADFYGFEITEQMLRDELAAEIRFADDRDVPIPRVHDGIKAIFDIDHGFDLGDSQFWVSARLPYFCFFMRQSLLHRSTSVVSLTCTKTALFSFFVCIFFSSQSLAQNSANQLINQLTDQRINQSSNLQITKLSNPQINRRVKIIAATNLVGYSGAMVGLYSAW